MYLHPIFSNLPQAERAALVQCSVLRSFRRNETVLAVGELTDNVYCVAGGLLRVVAYRGSGAHVSEITTDFIRQDDFFLPTSFSDEKYQAMKTLVAALPSTVYLVPVSAIHKLCLSHSEVAIGLLSLALKRTDLLRSQLRRISSLSTEDLVCRILQQLTLLAPSSRGAYDKRITQSVIASYSGLSREVVNRTLREMANRGLVRRDEHGIHVTGNFASTDFGNLPPV